MASFYMQRGMGGSGSPPGLHVPPGIRPLTNPHLPRQSSIGGASVGSAFPMESSTAISLHGISPGGPSSQAGMQISGEPVKRKRGRPRKYGPDGTVSLALSSISSSAAPSSGSASAPSSQKRGRGRPPGTGRKQQLASLDGGDILHPENEATIEMLLYHLIKDYVEERTNGTHIKPKDIATKIMTFSQQGPRAVCILSANGAVSTVTLRQPASSGGTVTHEGRFEILCLSGSYLLTDDGGSRNRTGGLSISLSSPDGRVIGGGVGGLLIAATPVQVIAGSFVYGGTKSKGISGAGPEPTMESEHPTGDKAVTPTSIPPSQNLSPMMMGGTGGWPGSRPMDMRNPHMDIDLTR
ncbi:hypothetical protein ACLOJK_024399 [Asimina triloba]